LASTVNIRPVSTDPGRSISPLAGKPAPRELLIDRTRLEHEYYERHPDPRDPASGWFAVRPSDTADIYKIHARTLQGEAHLTSIVGEAQEIVGRALESAA
jgi:hypothetical protein